MLMAVFPLLSGKSLCMKYDLSNNNLIIKSRTMLRLQPVTPADKEALSYIEDLYVKSFLLTNVGLLKSWSNYLEILLFFIFVFYAMETRKSASFLIGNGPT